MLGGITVTIIQWRPKRVSIGAPHQSLAILPAPTARQCHRIIASLLEFLQRVPAVKRLMLKILETAVEHNDAVERLAARQYIGKRHATAESRDKEWQAGFFLDVLDRCLRVGHKPGQGPRLHEPVRTVVVIRHGMGSIVQRIHIYIARSEVKPQIVVFILNGEFTVHIGARQIKKIRDRLLAGHAETMQTDNVEASAGLHPGAPQGLRQRRPLGDRMLFTLKIERCTCPP